MQEYLAVAHHAREPLFADGHDAVLVVVVAAVLEAVLVVAFAHEAVVVVVFD